MRLSRQNRLNPRLESFSAQYDFPDPDIPITESSTQTPSMQCFSAVILDFAQSRPHTSSPRINISNRTKIFYSLYSNNHTRDFSQLRKRRLEAVGAFEIKATRTTSLSPWFSKNSRRFRRQILPLFSGPRSLACGCQVWHGQPPGYNRPLHSRD